MNESQKLFKAAHDLFEQAKAALVKGEDAEALQKQAEETLARAEKVKAIETQQKALAEPIRDVPLPTDNGSPLAQPPAPTPPENELNKSIYQLRFGETDQATKAILLDLHGSDYQNKVLEQKAAFIRYIRRGEKELSGDEARILKTIFISPQQAREQMAKGIDVRDLKSALVEAIDTLGGYAVPVDISMDIIKRVMGMTVMRGRGKTRQTSRDRLEILKRTGGDDQYTGNVRVTWVDETPTAGTADTNPTFGMEGIPVHTVMAETFMSRNVVEDAAYDLVADLTEQLSEAAAIDEDNRFLTGDGVGKPQGLLPGGANSLGIGEVNSGAADALTWSASATKGLVALTYGIAAQYRQNAVWIGERSTYGAIAAMTDGVQQPLWREQYGRASSEGGAGTLRLLMGYPVLEQEAMPSVGANTYPLLFGDPRGYTIVDRIGMTIERYLDSATARANQVCYVMRRRLGGQPTELYRFVCMKVAS
jgi:HK97 family phage major capsid protein